MEHVECGRKGVQQRGAVSYCYNQTIYLNQQVRPYLTRLPLPCQQSLAHFAPPFSTISVATAIKPCVSSSFHKIRLKITILTMDASYGLSTTTNKPSVPQHRSSRPELPACRKCTRRLKEVDRQKSTGRFWKTCKGCRDRRTEANRRSKNYVSRCSAAAATAAAGGGLGSYKRREDTPIVLRRGFGQSVVLQDVLTAQRDLPEGLIESLGSGEAWDLPSDPASPETGLDTATNGYDSEVIRLLRELDDMSEDGEEQDQGTDHQAGLRECSVCADTLPIPEFASLMACHHAPDVCQSCFLGWLDQEMPSTNCEQLRCPSSSCGNFVTHEDVQKYASTDVFTR